MNAQTLTPEAAGTIVAEALHRVVPDADLDAAGPDANLREEFELDSLDFLAFVEQLSKRAGRRIDEEDYDRLTTSRSCVDFICRP